MSLSGPGGIGKTSVALKVLTELAANSDPRFEAIIWFSARDIDLLPQGPRTVRPHAISLQDFALQYSKLVGHESAENAVDELSSAMSGVDPLFQSTLFVFDNFETVAQPGEIFAWLDLNVRAPNKILITTRVRAEFTSRLSRTRYGDGRQWKLGNSSASKAGSWA